MRVGFRSHPQMALLQVEIAQLLSRGTTAVDACGVNLVVAVRLGIVEDGGGGGEVVDACLFDAWLAHSHGAQTIGNLVLRGETWC